VNEAVFMEIHELLFYLIYLFPFFATP